MFNLDLLKKEINVRPSGIESIAYYKGIGYRKNLNAPWAIARANAVESLFTNTKKNIYKNDLICGSTRGMYAEVPNSERKFYEGIDRSFGERHFWQNFDHFSPNYAKILRIGIVGILDEIENSKKAHAGEPAKIEYLEGMEISMLAFQQMVLGYALKAKSLIGTKGYDDQNLRSIADNCTNIAQRAPQSFVEALQLVWLCHVGFCLEGRYAMALGRIDQYLYPFYEKDKKENKIDYSRAVALLENVFIKIGEKHSFCGSDDVVNICIGGLDKDEKNAVNELSYAALEAVRNCQIPGPNLSARVSDKTPDEFVDACLKVIGTGLGYPALMNDNVNIAALEKYGYDRADALNYTMVGCIENFLTGQQPPWSDGRFDTPRYIEYVLNDGIGYLNDNYGIPTGKASEISSMKMFMERLEKQIAYGAQEYIANFNNENARINTEMYVQPFLSCFCDDCIARGLDVCGGGSKYPSVHGVAVMGVGTMCDSLAAIEKVVFDDKKVTLPELNVALLHNFEGYEDLREELLRAPKYGNNDDYADKYAVWFVDFLRRTFEPFHTRDGGPFYIAMAANIVNIASGKTIGATPDGRKAGEPLSDAASPTYGRDVNGATSTVLSVSKPDYSKVACGTVLNQKFSPNIFVNEANRKKLLALIRVYFGRGGQEMQINATSREVLINAMKNPEEYKSLVVRVSGFSAYYVTLDRDVQLDILHRTQQC